MTSEAQRTVISDEQVEAYRDRGYVVVDAVYSPEEVGEMRRVLDGLVAGARRLAAHDAVYDLEPSHAPDRPRVRRIKSPHRVHPLFRRMAGHPRVVAVLERLIGPDLRLHGSKINLKPADHGSPVEWHQDWAFYPHTNDDVLAVGVMLDDMTPDNGPMLVIPGSHRGPTYDHHQDGRFLGAIDPASCGIDFSTAEAITGAAGACSFHHVRAVHGSGENASGGDRRLLLYQVAAGDAWDLRGLQGLSWEQYEATMLSGKASREPRIEPAPVRLPYPGPLRGGSIYESQSLARNRYFADAAATRR